MNEWEMEEPGWYGLYRGNECVAAVCCEGSFWAVYIDEDMPPGDSQHKTMREAKAEAERRIG